MVTWEKSSIFVFQSSIIRVRLYFTRNSYAFAFIRNNGCVFLRVYTRRAPRVPHFSAFHFHAVLYIMNQATAACILDSDEIRNRNTAPHV